jgi:hypothetical protein
LGHLVNGHDDEEPGVGVRLDVAKAKLESLVAREPDAVLGQVAGSRLHFSGLPSGCNVAGSATPQSMRVSRPQHGAQL